MQVEHTIKFHLKCKKNIQLFSPKLQAGHKMHVEHIINFTYLKMQAENKM